MKESTKDEIIKTLEMLNDKIGGKTMIIFTHLDKDNESTAGGAIGDGVEWDEACMMAMDISCWISESFQE